MKLFTSYIINLDDRKDRLSDFLINHEEFGYSNIEFSRVSAVRDENFGGIGCAKSHVLTLCDFIAKENSPYCLIVEDDFRFKIDAEKFNNNVIPFIKSCNSLKVFLMAGTKTLSSKINEDFVEIFESQTTSGYIVSRDYAPILINCFLRSIILMERFREMDQRNLIYDRFSIDQAWKKLQQEGGWFACSQMIGYQAASFSDIEKKNVDYSGISS